MPNSKAKGNRGELEAAKALGAVKVSRLGYPGHDLEWYGYPVEVKLYAKPVSKKITTILEDVTMLVERADFGEWIAHLRVSDLLDIIDQRAREIDSENT